MGGTSCARGRVRRRRKNSPRKPCDRLAQSQFVCSGSAGAAAWIFTIARNLRIDALRREWRNGCELGIDKEVANERHV